MAKIYFDDITEEMPLACEPVRITRSQIITFAREYDPQRFHLDESFAGKSVFKGLVASSLHTLSACTKSVVDAQGDMAIISGVGMDEVKMYTPVRPDDVLYVSAQWCDLKPSKSKSDTGFARIRCRVVNQKGEKVIDYGYQYLIACKKNRKNTE